MVEDFVVCLDIGLQVRKDFALSPRRSRLVLYLMGLPGEVAPVFLRRLVEHMPYDVWPVGLFDPVYDRPQNVALALRPIDLELRREQSDDRLGFVLRGDLGGQLVRDI